MNRATVMKASARFTRPLVLWFVFLMAAILNGALRQKVLVAALGDPGAHVVSSVLLSVLILAVTWFAFPWLRIGTSGDAWRLGGSWLGLTLAFEFLAGHYLFRAPWSSLLADYNLAEGRIWILVMLATWLAPVAAHALRAKNGTTFGNSDGRRRV